MGSVSSWFFGGTPGSGRNRPGNDATFLAKKHGEQADRRGPTHRPRDPYFLHPQPHPSLHSRPFRRPQLQNLDIKDDVLRVARPAPRPPMLVRWSRELAHIPPRRAWMWGLSLLAAIAVADHVTGYRFELSRFHMAPVALLSWVVGR